MYQLQRMYLINVGNRFIVLVISKNNEHLPVRGLQIWTVGGILPIYIIN